MIVTAPQGGSREQEQRSTEVTDWGIQPQLESTGDEEVTFEPAVVTKVDAILPWEMNQDKNLCGDTRIEQNGDNNYRATIEGVIFKSQLSTLAELRSDSNEVRLITTLTRELGIPTVAFDRLQITRNASISHGDFTYQGETVKEPLYEFQLQSKENENSS